MWKGSNPVAVVVSNSNRYNATAAQQTQCIARNMPFGSLVHEKFSIFIISSNFLNYYQLRDEFLK